MNFTPFCSASISICGFDELEKRFINSFSGKKIALLLSGSAALRFGLTPVIDSLSAKNDLIWIKDIPQNPTNEDLSEALRIVGQKNLELIIAIGGGSAIDLAKGIVALHNPLKALSGEDVLKKIKEKAYTDRKIKIIAVPTTAGTGSELTPWATIWKKCAPGLNGEFEKLSIDAPFLKPQEAIIVPELTLTMSKKLTLATGLDALCHAVEAYWSKRSDSIVRGLAHRSVEIILKALPKVLQTPNSLTYREDMATASVLAGLAFSQTKTTACHSISYPLTACYGVPHGLACAMTIPLVLEKNMGGFAGDSELNELFEVYGGAQNWLDNVYGVNDTHCIYSLKLSDYGASKEDIPQLSDLCFTKERMENNPVALQKEDVTEILERIL